MPIDLLGQRFGERRLARGRYVLRWWTRTWWRWLPYVSTRYVLLSAGWGWWSVQLMRTAAHPRVQARRRFDEVTRG